MTPKYKGPGYSHTMTRLIAPLLLALGACVPESALEPTVEPEVEADTTETPEEVADPERDTDVDTEPLPEVDAGCDDTLITVLGTDPWGRETGVDEQVRGVSASVRGSGQSWWASSASQAAEVDVSGVDLTATSVRIDWDGGQVAVSGGRDRSRWGVTSSVRDVDGLSCPTQTVWVGLDHHWFAPSARPPSNNDVDVLFDGEDGWQAVADMLGQAQERITWSTWYWESDFELVRPAGHERLSEAFRADNTVLSRVEQASVDTRVLINLGY